MGHVFSRHSKAAPPEVSYGDGCYLYDVNGKKYLDGCGGAAVSCLGHSDTEVTKAIKSQLDKVAFAHTGFFTSKPAEDLCDLLVEHAPKDIDRVYLVSGGSEAVEAALKLARQYFLEIGQPARNRVITRKQSYHGNTLGALAVGGNMWRREPFDPLMIHAFHIPPCFAYRDQQLGESEFDYGRRVANTLEEKLLCLGPDTVMAFIAEPVVGATLGAVPAVDGYFKRVRDICTKYGVLLILDEVMCGMGRTGTMFASEQEDITPDIVCIAKGLGAGYMPIGAMMCSVEIYTAIEQGSGFFQHGHTYMGHPTVAAGSLAVVKAIIERNLLANVIDKGIRLRSALEQRFGQHSHVGDIRGRGLFMGIELVKNRETKASFSPTDAINKKIKKAAFDAGLMCYPMGGTIDGKQGDHVLIAPPFIINGEQIDELADKLLGAVNSACYGVK